MNLLRENLSLLVFVYGGVDLVDGFGVIRYAGCIFQLGDLECDCYYYYLTPWLEMVDIVVLVEHPRGVTSII